MLDFKFASVLMAIITSALLIVILTLILLNETILYKFGLSILSVFCALIVIRMAIPFEFTEIAITIKIPTVVSRFFTYLQYPRIFLFGNTYSIWEFFIFIWCIIFAIRFLRYLYLIKKMYNFTKSYGIDVTDNYISLIDKICTKKELMKKISVIKLPMIPIPSVFRYKLHYYILIPANLELNEEETELIFRHELSHVTHHDLTLKFLVQTLCFFYWWNPFCILLRRQSNLLFELRVDSYVVSKGHDKIERYLACLLKVKEYSADKKSKLPLSTTISFLPKQSSALNKRFRFLMESDTAKNKYLAKLILLPVCVIYLVSFIFIFESYYRRPEDTKRGTSLSSQNMYIVINDKSTYDIYFNGIYAETVDSLDNFPKNCKIYLSLEEAKENEEN